MASPRTSRANLGIMTKAVARMAFTRLGPKAAARAKARMSDGKDRMTSMKRMMTLSVLPPKYPDVAPMSAPVIPATEMTRRPMDSEMRAPNMTREKMSRPSSSVPK